MKRLALLFLFLCGSVSLAADRRIAFERDDAVYVGNLEATLVRKLSDGVFPAISPDAQKVVFSNVESTPARYRRRIGIIDTISGKFALLENIPSDNSYQARWSPNGDWIAFVLQSGGQLRLGRVKPDGTGFSFIGNARSNEAPFYSPCWAADGASLYCQDTANIYLVALDGSVRKTWAIDKIAPGGAMSADARIDLSPDGRHLLLSIDMDEEYDRKNWDGPVPALWSFDPETEIGVRLSSKNLFAWDGSWLDNANILFVSQPAGETIASIYRTNGKNLKRLIENARRPSVSRP